MLNTCFVSGVCLQFGSNLVSCGHTDSFQMLIEYRARPHCLARPPPLDALPQHCLLHLGDRGCLATRPLISRTMESLLIVGVCFCGYV